MVDFAKLKNQSLEKLAKKIEEQAAGNNFADDRYWQPTMDKAGNGSAIIRLLPAAPQDLEVDDDAAPFVKYFDHNFKGPGGWYIERCLTSLGHADPCAEYNNKLWNTEIEANQNIARRQKRNTRYISGIKIISDPGNPVNDGLVKLYKYGPKLFEKFQAAMEGDEDTPGFNPWNFWEGANFRIKIKTTVDKKTNGKFRNYDDSKFAPQSPLSKDDDELQVIWMQQHSLLAEVAPDKYKSFDELKKQLNKVLALADNVAGETVKETAETRPMEVKSTIGDVEVKSMPWEETGETDSVLSKFQELANL